MRYSVLCIILFFTYSCKKNVYLETPGGANQVVLNGTLCPDSVVKIFLCKSKDIQNQNPIESINDATAKLYENGNLVANLENKGNGQYFSEFKPMQGKNYKLIAQTLTTNQIECSDSIPKVVKINNVATTIENSNIICRINLTDPAQINNYYLLRLFFKQTSNSSPIALEINTFDFPVYNKKFLFFDDKGFDGKEHELVITLNNTGVGNLIVSLATISKSYFEYCKSLQLIIDNANNLLAENPQVKGNIIGGKGIFAAFSNNTYEIEIH